jgi:hypothetical protein
MSSGNSLYESSIAGGSAIGSVFGGLRASRLNENVPDWIRNVQALNLDRRDREHSPSGSVISSSIFSRPDDAQTMTTEQTEMSASKAQDVKDWDDEFEVGVARHALKLGQEAFGAADFHVANEHLQVVLEMAQQVSSDHRSLLKSRDVQYMLAVCAFNTRDAMESEAALIDFLEKPTTSTRTEAIHLCHAGHLLAIVCLKRGQLDRAESSCHGAARGRWRLFCDKDPSYYESLALLARIHEVRGNVQKMKLYGSMIPQDSAEALLQKYALIGVTKDRPHGLAATTLGQMSQGSLLIDSGTTPSIPTQAFPSATTTSSPVPTAIDSVSAPSTLAQKALAASTTRSVAVSADPPDIQAQAKIALRSGRAALLKRLEIVASEQLQDAFLEGDTNRVLKLTRVSKSRYGC